MIRLFVRYTARLLAGAVLVHAAAVHGQGSPAQIGIQVVGAGSACSGFTLGGTAANPVLTCVPVSGPQPFNCAIIGAPSAPVAIGAAVTLTASCSGGTPGYTYSWSPGGSTSAAISASTGSAGATIYSMTGRDANGTSSAQAVTVTVSGGGGGGGGPISCPGFNNTVVVDLDWNNPQRGIAHVGSNDAVVVRFTPSSAPLSALSNVTGAEWGSGPATRIGTLSTSACEFAGTGAPPALGWGAATGGTTITLWFSIGPNNYGYPGGLAVGTPLFVNVKTTSCSSGACDMYFDLSK